MATKLFINRTDMIRNSVMDANINSDKFIQFLKIAQEITIQSYLRTDLYDKITSLLPTAINDAANLTGAAEIGTMFVGSDSSLWIKTS